MLGVQIAALLDGDVPGAGQALELVAGFDEALAGGFARLGEERAGALTALAGAMAGTPLGERAAEAAAKIAAGSVGEEHLAALAAARAALLGAVHDGLLDRLDTALGRDRDPWPAARPASGAPPATPVSDTTPASETAGGRDAPGGPGGVPANLLAACRSWLHEVAITGWRGVDHDLVSASSQTIEALLAEPGARRLAVLLDGLAAELAASVPIGLMASLPARRWGDLWTRAVLLAQPGAPAGGHGAVPVSGRLLVLGVDVHEHGTAVQVQVHGVLEPAGGEPKRLVRASVGAMKVDTITGPSVWRLLTGHPVLLAALAEHRALDLTGMPLLPGGDLVWHDDRARAGEPADPFAVARLQLAGAPAAPVPPLDRHPVRIAEPVLVEGYTASDDGTLTLDGGTLTFDMDRLPSCGPLTPQLVAASSACVGLVRWDAGRWLLQPLAVQATVKRKPVEAGNGDWALGPTDPKAVKAEAKAGDVVAVLKERAGRLLRR
ncbi:hypothetical protein [Nonomuraea roseoviolacea]|uniref:SWIM zinc finger family protein n=1 Tax=Nonomuraea roseoviolacea subsp. carminata TaxID=160689 RepID=A0ABT1K149_9ACTN|nr:hypothetical protein [Nonomuraea roseoviolacea]MCP2347332.1 hypothetical protein [Nonomuraea roseoviolacea subsp. carminata]